MTLNPYSYCARGSGWTLADCYQNGWDPNAWHTPPPPRNVTARLGSSGASVLLTWQAGSGLATNYEVLKDLSGDYYVCAALSSSTFSYSEPVMTYEDGEAMLCQYVVRANFADGSHADSPATALIGGELNCEVHLGRGPGGGLYLALGPMPLNLASVRVWYEGTWDRQTQQPIADGWFDIPASAFTNDVARVPLEQNPASYVYSWYGVQCFGTNGDIASAQFVWAGEGSDSPGPDSYRFVDARRHMTENLKFLLRSATLTRPFSYAVGGADSWWKTDYPQGELVRGPSPTDYEYDGFHTYGPAWEQSFLMDLRPIQENFMFANFLYDPLVWGPVVSNTPALDDQDRPFRVLQSLAYHYDGLGTESPLPLALTNINQQWCYYYGVPYGPELGVGTEAGCVFDGGSGLKVGYVGNCYGLDLYSMIVDLGGTVYGQNQALPAPRTNPLTYYFPRFAVPQLEIVDYYFVSQTPYLNYSGPPWAYSGPAPLPGSPTFTPASTSPVLVTSVGQALTVSGWAKKRITNASPQGKFGYLEQYYEGAYDLLTTNESGLLSPYGEFFPTQPGTVALVTMPDIDTGQQGVGLVRVISLSTDVNHDGTLDTSFSGPDFTSPQHPFRFWVNDNVDKGDQEGTGIPGQNQLGDAETQVSVPGGMAWDGSPYNRSAWMVHGLRDLVDWFPVFVNIGSLFYGTPYGPSISVTDTNYHFRLRQADGALRFVYTGLGPTNYMSYLRDTNTASSLLDKEATLIDASGVDLTSTFLQGTANGSGGMLLMEGRTTTTEPLVLEVWQGTNLLASASLCLSISGVEDMFRHKNLIAETFPDLSGTGGPLDRLDGTSVWNEPDTSDNSFVFVHGYNVNPEQARGWNADMFKRMYWSGSQAKFYGVTWNGADSQGNLKIAGISVQNVTPNYHTNVVHALDTAHSLETFLSSLTNGPVTVAAHSLGNMVALSALSRWRAPMSNYFMIDAAVAMESLDGATQNELMVPTNWQSYPVRLYASSWSGLFTNTDYRSWLNWSNRFADLNDAQVYNFYSSGEEVLRSWDYEAPTNILTSSVQMFADWWESQTPVSAYTWVWQEKSKGLAQSDTLLGSTHGGWKFNTYYSGLTVAQASALPDSQLVTNAFFEFGSPSFPADLALEAPLGGLYASYSFNRVVADAVPALSWPVGANRLAALDRPGVPHNFDMMTLENGWPRTSGPEAFNWHHSDLRQVAYPFTYSVFNKFVEIGGLK